MKEDFSTIEHDYLHVKDCFNNIKFTYKERKGKLDFLQNIYSNTIQDSTPLLDTYKKQLEDVKSVYKLIDDEIKNYSSLIFEEELDLKKNKEILEKLAIEEQKLNKEFDSIKDLSEKMELNDKLNYELDNIEIEIKKIFSENENLGNEINKSSNLLSSKEEEINSLKALKTELAVKQKRLTIINIDNYIEDVYCWFELVNDIFNKIFGKITFYSDYEKYFIKVQKENDFIEVVLKDKKIVDATISKNLSEEKFKEFEKILNYSREINDCRLLLLFD